MKEEEEEDGEITSFYPVLTCFLFCFICIFFGLFTWLREHVKKSAKLAGGEGGYMVRYPLNDSSMYTTYYLRWDR